MFDIFNISESKGSHYFLNVDGQQVEVKVSHIDEISISTNGLGWGSNVSVKVLSSAMAGTEFTCRISWNVGGDRPACENMMQEIAGCVASRMVAAEIYQERMLEFDVYGEI